MLSNQIRSAFIDYFARNGHQVEPSSSLIPYGDKTILFTNAGMNQFKNLFLGLEKRNYTRAVTAQKVMRVSGKHNDLENVGPSPRHHTFFEMLGNFSFGDYFKADAMSYALELVTKVYGLDMDRLWFTIYREDDEAETLWKKLGVNSSRILRFGEKDNFWQMGDTGPCGPNSEIHYFTGDRKEDNTADHVNSDNDETTLEFWNLVFMQYDRDPSGKLTPLPRPSIDTGMGFERICRLVQGVPTNYETDLFAPVFERIQNLAGHTDEQRQNDYVAYRVVADHVRAASFLIGDGVLPGNEGRNYVLRMILRRAARFGRKIGFNDPFLYQVSDAVIQKMGEHYRELVERRKHILSTIHQEEERFARTLDIGLQRLDDIIDGLDKTVQPAVIPGDVAFKLYDTYGLPVEITRDEAKERGAGVDEAGFLAAREAARERNRGGDQFSADYDLRRAYSEALETLKSSGVLSDNGVAYDPYGPLTVDTEVAALLREGEMTEHAVAGEHIEIVLPRTPFYVEGGGQVSDTGVITARAINGEAPAWSVTVTDMRRPAPGFIVHVCEVTYGQPRIGDSCVAQVDETRRLDIMRNHTATHLLQKSLRAVVGDHVGQQGSLVAPDRLRFDYSHSAPLTIEQLDQVSNMLNDAILVNYPVTASQEAYKDVVKAGAMAFFSEKYGDIVRVLRIGEPGHKPFSMELCGGTHVKQTGDIGSALIVSETAVAAGVRRIEVLTGHGALRYAKRLSQQLASVAQALNTNPDQVTEQTAKVLTVLSDTQKTLEKAQKELARAKFNEMLAEMHSVKNNPVLVAQTQVESMDVLREMTDWFRDKHPSGVVVLGAVIGEKPAIVVAVSKDLNSKGLDAGKLAREIAKLVDGSGGGRPTLAQAGGKDATKLSAALAQATRLIESWLSA
ncbi:MAG: alanine--tRNA ligase [Chloroflexi bacterium]|nr:alanine--tRNA ligase [Chloroflexota bacterium]MCL5273688.1 alanine--tRNA ligase [Chloroflexota bacterium]